MNSLVDNYKGLTIAMAISCNPSVLMADEPTTALDVTVQATILDLLRNLCRKARYGFDFSSPRDLGVIAELVDSRSGNVSRKSGGVRADRNCF